MGSLEASRSHTLVTTVAALVGLAGVLNVGLAADAEDPDGLVQQVVAQTTRSGFALRASRHLEAGSVSGKHRGWMDVDTSVSPAGIFSWTVLGEGGSERTRDKVFRAVLEAEVEAGRAGSRDAAALSLANYQFVNEGPAGDGQTRVRLVPRRADAKLVNGSLIVSADGHPVLLEGRLAKSPSFWVKSVTVVKHYACIGGVSLPVSVESLADVKMIGQSSFSMRYRYMSVNGRSVGHSASAAPGFGPSPEIVALHRAVQRRPIKPI
jgi:hypothetical protein